MHQRKFIFLEAIDGYSVNNKNVKGHAQFSEMKNKVEIKLFIEGLEQKEYGVDLLLEESMCVNIGHFSGKNNHEIKLNVNNRIKDINAILIYPFIDKRNISLVGYLSEKKKIDIKDIEDCRVSKSMPEKSSQVIGEVKSIEKKFIIEDEEVYGVNNPKDYREDNLISMDDHDHEDLQIGLNKGEKINQENIAINTHHEKLQENKGNKIDTQCNERMDQKGAIYNNQIFYLWENLDKLDNSLKPADPFMQPVPKHKWWQIKEYDTEIQYYCILYNGYLMPMIYPFMNYKNMNRIEKEWVFGVVTEDYGEKEVLKYFVYGIPGKFYMQEQPFKGSTGYLYWQSLDVVSKDPMGYWLLYVDVHTGKIVIPRRPVRPPLNKNIMHNNM